jgi:signal peptidase I
MASGTTFPLGLTVAPAREHAPLPLRILSSLLITTAFAIAIGVPLLLSGVTGFHLWYGSGQSMEPTLEAGDMMITRQVSAAGLKPGDIIMFDGGENHVMHRIVSIEAGPAGEATLITRGDNNDANDPPVPESAILGKLVYEVPFTSRIPVDLSGTGLFVAEWMMSVSLVTMGLLLRRNTMRPRRVPFRRSYAR